MPRYANQFQNNPSLKWKDFTSLQELPRIFVNVTNAIGMFVDIWLGEAKEITHCHSKATRIFASLGKEIDRTCLSNPKPSNNSTATMNDNAQSTAMGNNPTAQARLLSQSVRGNPPISQQATAQTSLGTLKSSKAQGDSRRGERAESSESLSSSISFSVSTKKSGNIYTPIEISH